jgi:plasmid maintenance system antidote protein VapI
MMALRFEKAFGISADTLLRMQVAYDLAQVRLSGKEPDVARVTDAA